MSISHFGRTPRLNYILLRN